MLEGVKAMGYVEPTAIQLRTIPLIMEGKDVIGSAQTGTGKTAAFALPILTLLGESTGRTRALILEPTRELAAQVETAMRDFSRFSVHGSIAAVVVFLIWVYLSAVILLYGAEVSAAYARLRKNLPQRAPAAAIREE